MTWRWLLWRSVLRLCAGLRVTGSAPDGACVVVAHHTSHADTPALLAALGPRRVAVLAAGDYWTGWRGTLCRVVAGGVPIPRTGGGDLGPIVELLRSGTTVVIFPEGTRAGGTPSDPGRFRSGATRLATAAGVPLVPVGLVGTARLLPRHCPPRPAPVQVRFGAPLPGDMAPEQLRLSVARLGIGPARWPASPTRTALRHLAASRAALVLVAVWAAAEAVSWPVVPELVVCALTLVLPRRGPALALSALVGSIAGLLLTTALIRADVHPAQPLTTQRMRIHVEQALARGDVRRVVADQAWTGIPAKVYARETAERRSPLVATVEGWAVGRGRRMLLCATLAGLVGLVVGRRALVRFTGPLLLGAGLIFAEGWVRVLQAWT